MPKMKTNSGAKKRFKVSGSGKLVRKQAYKSHILTKKSIKRKRALGLSMIVADADTRKVKTLLAMH